MGYRVAILGATGAVGGELLKLIDERSFPADSILLLASARSKGREVQLGGKTLTVEELTHDSFVGVDLVLSSASTTISKEYVPSAVRAGAVVVDNTSAFRMDPDVPLVIPEVNGRELSRHKGIIANPNCVAMILCVALNPLYRAFGVRRVAATTYQAASGAGKRAMDELLEETQAFIEGRQYTRTVIPHPYAFNFFVHNTPMNEHGYVGEEWKVINETRKILDDPGLRINATCIRVPVLRAHGIALNVQFDRQVTPEEALRVFGSAPGVAVVEDPEHGRFPMPVEASGRDEVFVGRVRRDLSQDNALDIWVVGDQIRKGAALNAIQIAEAL